MSGISIDKNIVPGEKVTFRIDMSFFGYGKTMEFDFIAPNAAPLLSRINNINLKSEKGPEKEKTKGNYSFSKYAKGSSIDSNFYKLKILLNSAKQANQLEPGETINLTSSDAKLAQLNNKNYKVIKDTNKDARYVYLRVSNADQPTVNSGTAAGSLQEITGTTKTKKYTVTLPKNVIKGLLAEKLPGTTKEGMMEDVPIFAYKRFKGSNKTSVKRQLMVNDAEVKDKEPPDRNDVLQYRGKESYFKIFDINDKEKFIFYVAIARYTYDGSVWKKEWVQTNASDEALWGKATERKTG
jgi:hypothetical protein